MKLIRQTRHSLTVILLIAPLLALGACASKKSLEGGASDNGGGALMRLGLPF